MASPSFTFDSHTRTRQVGLHNSWLSQPWLLVLPLVLATSMPVIASSAVSAVLAIKTL